MEAFQTDEGLDGGRPVADRGGDRCAGARRRLRRAASPGRSSPRRHRADHLLDHRRTSRSASPATCWACARSNGVRHPLPRVDRGREHRRRQPCRQRRSTSRTISAASCRRRCRPAGATAAAAPACTPSGPRRSPPDRSACPRAGTRTPTRATRRRVRCTAGPRPGSRPRPTTSCRSSTSYTDAAITDTVGVVRVRPGSNDIVSTEFSASNGPRTAGGAFPSVDDGYDDHPGNPNHRWTRIIDADAIRSRYGLASANGVMTAVDAGLALRGHLGERGPARQRVDGQRLGLPQRVRSAIARLRARSDPAHVHGSG